MMVSPEWYYQEKLEVRKLKCKGPTQPLPFSGFLVVGFS